VCTPHLITVAPAHYDGACQV